MNGVASTTSEKSYYRGNQTQNQDGTGGNYDHAGNDVHIGPDGKLWWSVGDNVPAITNGEALNNIYGKVLRFNLDGTVPSDNPFVNVVGAVPYIYALGLRNPWRFTFLPNGKAMTEDTGSSYWEDLDTAVSGANYGWPIKEGNCGSCGYANPAYGYGHYPTDAAASAIAAYSGLNLPTGLRPRRSSSATTTSATSRRSHSTRHTRPWCQTPSSTARRGQLPTWWRVPTGTSTS